MEGEGAASGKKRHHLLRHTLTAERQAAALASFGAATAEAAARTVWQLKWVLQALQWTQSRCTACSHTPLLLFGDGGRYRWRQQLVGCTCFVRPCPSVVPTLMPLLQAA